MILSEDEVEFLKSQIGPAVMQDWDSCSDQARGEAQADLFHLLLPLLNSLPRVFTEDPSQALVLTLHEETLAFLTRRRLRIMAYRGMPIDDIHSTFTPNELVAAGEWVREALQAALRLLSPSSSVLRELARHASTWDADADLARLLEENPFPPEA